MDHRRAGDHAGGAGRSHCATQRFALGDRYASVGARSGIGRHAFWREWYSVSLVAVIEDPERAAVCLGLLAGKDVLASAGSDILPVLSAAGRQQEGMISKRHMAAEDIIQLAADRDGAGMARFTHQAVYHNASDRQAARTVERAHDTKVGWRLYNLVSPIVVK